MFQRILVPLDGSPRAEEALPLAAQLARSTSATLFLLCVVPPPIYSAPIATEPAYMRANATQADLREGRAYLERVITAHHLNDIRVEKSALEGSPALTILQFAQQRQVDLLIMRSHGQTGFLRWMLGSVAQQLVRHSPIPILVLRDTHSAAQMDASTLTHPLRILVPLDGTPEAEAALSPAAQLCSALAAPGKGTIHLTRTVHQLSVKGEEEQALVEKMNREARAEAEVYLKNVSQRFLNGDLAPLHLSVTTSVVSHRDAGTIWKRVLEESECIGDVPGYTGCDIIAMATHGRSGFHRLLEGSVTEQILDTSSRPLLVVHPQPTTP